VSRAARRTIAALRAAIAGARPGLPPARAALLAGALLAAAPGAPRAGSAAPPPAAAPADAAADSGLAGGARPWPARVTARPARVALAQPIEYRAWVLVPRAASARWLKPDGGGAMTWGALQARRAPGGGRAALDTLVLESRLQIFAIGPVTVPGPAFRVTGVPGGGVRRLPTVRVWVTPSPGVADSAADLKPVRGPLAAPWWERVPWRIVLLVALALLALAALIVAWRRRRRRVVAAPATAPMALARDPAEVVLAELAALRARRLPEQGHFAEHALELTRIARRFLEATAGTPLPGDTTPELVGHLEAARLDPADVARVAALLGTWDRIKFARAPATIEEARRAEAAVEELARRRLAARAAPAAAQAQVA